MNKKLGIRQAVAAAFLASFVTGALAQAIVEVEQNYPIGAPPLGAAQLLTIESDGTATVNGTVGLATGGVIGDVDFYRFNAKKFNAITKEGLLTIDIDGGIKPVGSGLRSLDATLTLLGPAPRYLVLRESIDVKAGTEDELGIKNSHWNPYIADFAVPEDGEYTVAVTGNPRRIRDGGVIWNDTSTNSNGTYTLIISGAEPTLQEININIDVKPGTREHTKINPKAKGVIPVALLSSETFDALTVDQALLTFGTTGEENSLAHCQKGGRDVNGDGRPDLVCFFDNERTKFDTGDVEGIVKGAIAGGKRFKGHGILKVVGVEKQKDD